MDELSERYSQKCLELSRVEQRGKGRESELSHKDKELEQLRRENQVCTHAHDKGFYSVAQHGLHTGAGTITCFQIHFLPIAQCYCVAHEL